MSKCSWPRCRQPEALVWLGKALCQAHWAKICEMTDEQTSQEVARRLINRNTGCQNEEVDDER
jgi:hypothetical protein